MSAASVRRARRRDRQVYLRSHPVLFLLLAAARRRDAVRLGRTLVVNGTEAYRDVLTRLPLDRRAAGTTGGVARERSVESLLFDQDGAEHRSARRAVAADLGAGGVARLRPVWLEVLERRLAPLGDGDEVDLVDVSAELAGATTAALLDLDVPAAELAAAVREAAAGAVRAHLPGLRLRPGGRAPAAGPATAEARVVNLVGGAGRDGAEVGRHVMLALAAVNTTVAGLPRAAAWCADAGLWADAADAARRPVLVAELLRVVAPSPVLPRAAASDGAAGACRVRAGDRLVLVARHAAHAHRRDPDAHAPAPAAVAQLVFGAGPHACPGAGLARAQLDDLLRLLAPFRPQIVRARAARSAALPGWALLTVRGRR
ncbi:MAG TPA: cytochrome P450 [Actinomycetes bacterium]